VIRCRTQPGVDWSVLIGVFVLDLVYVLGVIVLFVIIGLVGKAVERL
jgi:hypothetical protein